MTRIPIRTLALFMASIARAQQPIPIVVVPPSEARSPVAVRNVWGVHELRDGRVLLNDASGRKLWLFDAKLQTAIALADTAPSSQIRYPPNSGIIVPYIGDSVLLIDAGALGVVVLDPQARFVRVMALPKPADGMTIVAMTGVAFVDPKGRLIYRGVMPRVQPSQSPAPRPAISPTALDSAPIVRADFETRRVDTLGMVAIPTMRSQRTEMRGRMTITPIVDPLPLIDNWAVTSDGSVAIVRPRDYHIDWVRPDGATISTPKMPFDWRKLTDDDKVALIDSARKAREKLYQDRGWTLTPMEWVSPGELPDYYPPVFQNTIRADLDAHLWIPPSTSLAAKPGMAVYDVVDLDGRLLTRVEISQKRALVGFGRAGAMYLAESDSTGVHLTRARLIVKP